MTDLALPLSPQSRPLPGSGTIRPIIRWGDPVMHQPARTVERFDAELVAAVADMVATMNAAQGVGLAACQIGIDLAVFVFDCPNDDGVRHTGVVCNPQLEVREGTQRRLYPGDEGCLSYPGAFVDFARPDWARVSGVDATGAEVNFEGHDFLARCFQHETDHTHGTVFGDRLAARSRKKLRKQMEAAASDHPPQWPASLD